MPDAMAAADLKRWSEMPENFEKIKAAFQTTTRFGERDVYLMTLILYSHTGTLRVYARAFPQEMEKRSIEEEAIQDKDKDRGADRKRGMRSSCLREPRPSRCAVQSAYSADCLHCCQHPALLASR